jgi:hypothetical protein
MNVHVWREWNEEYVLKTSTFAFSATDTNTRIWREWCDGTDSSATTSYVNDHVWKIWIKDYELNDEQIKEQSKIRAEREERERIEREERSKRIAESNRKRQQAEISAKELLKDLIGEEQLKIYEETGRLYVRGKKFDYIVPKDGTIKQIQKDKVVDLCVHLREHMKYPPTDNVIALKLSLEADEDSILKMANNHGERPLSNLKLPKAACME